MREVTQAPNALREAREAAGLSQAELAARVGVSKQAISDIELGEKVPSLERAAAIARVLGGTVDALFLAGTSTETVDNSEHCSAPDGAPATGSAPTRPGVAGTASIAPDRTGAPATAGNRSGISGVST